MPRTYLIQKNSPQLNAYKQYILNIIYMLEPNINKINPNIISEISQLVDFNVKLANVRIHIKNTS